MCVKCVYFLQSNTLAEQCRPDNKIGRAECCGKLENFHINFSHEEEKMEPG